MKTMEKEPKVKLASAAATDVSAETVVSGPALIPAEAPASTSGSESKSGTGDQKFSKKFLFVTDEALSVDLAWKMKEEGNEVKMYIGNEADQDIGEGFIEKCDDWKTC